VHRRGCQLDLAGNLVHPLDGVGRLGARDDAHARRRLGRPVGDLGKVESDRLLTPGLRETTALEELERGFVSGPSWSFELGLCAHACAVGDAGEKGRAYPLPTRARSNEDVGTRDGRLRNVDESAAHGRVSSARHEIREIGIAGQVVAEVVETRPRGVRVGGCSYVDHGVEVVVRARAGRVPRRP
jgi:hypothetical protein